jgi:hypothetical protein
LALFRGPQNIAVHLLTRERLTKLILIYLICIVWL